MKTTILRSIILSTLALALGLALMLGSTAFAAEGAAYQSALDTTDMFTDRDLAQTADLADAVYYSVSSGEDIHIDSAGVYVLSGSASDVTIYVEAGDEDKVQLVLDGVEITINNDFEQVAQNLRKKAAAGKIDPIKIGADLIDARVVDPASYKKVYEYYPLLVDLFYGKISADDFVKLSSFELFRKNIISPEIITFDELYARAKFIVDFGQTMQSDTPQGN